MIDVSKLTAKEKRELAKSLLSDEAVGTELVSMAENRKDELKAQAEKKLVSLGNKLFSTVQAEKAELGKVFAPVVNKRSKIYSKSETIGNGLEMSVTFMVGPEKKA